MYPGHPNLLPAYLDDPHELVRVRPQAQTRSGGANITIVGPGMQLATGGVYGEEGFVYQLLSPLPQFDDMRPVLGASGLSATRPRVSASGRPRAGHR